MLSDCCVSSYPAGCYSKKRGQFLPQTFYNRQLFFSEHLHYTGQPHVFIITSKKGRWVVGRKTYKKRLGRAIRAITGWCRKNRDKSKAEQHKELSAKLRGQYAY
jgi:hypothetical protein